MSNLRIFIPFFMGRCEKRFEYRDTLHRSQSFRTFVDIIVPNFGGTERTTTLIMKTSNSNSVLLKDSLLASLQLQKDVLELTAKTETGDSIVSFKDICVRKFDGSGCIYDSIFARLRWNETILENMTQIDIDNAFISAYYNPEVALPTFVGDIQLSSDGNSILSATSIRFFLPGKSPSDKVTYVRDLLSGKSDSKVLDDAKLWEQEFLQYVCSGVPCSPNIQEKSSWNRDNYIVSGVTSRSISDEVNRNATESVMYMQGALFLILLLMWLMLGGWPLRDSRFALGVGALVTINCSLICGFGITSLVQVPLSDMSLILVFVVVGVGVDDIIIVVDSLDRQKKYQNERMEKFSNEESIECIAKAIGDAGPTIFLTSFTNLVAFLVAATTDFGGARWFCISGGFILFSLFLLTVTFFTAILTIDEKRREQKRLDCVCCIKYSNGEEKEKRSMVKKEEKDNNLVSSEEVLENVKITTKDCEAYDTSVFSKIVSGWIQLLSNRIISATIVVIFLCLIPIGFGIIIPRLTLGADVADYFPDDSYYSAYLSDSQKLYESLSSPTYLIFKDIAFDDPSVRIQISQLILALNNDDIVFSPYQSMFQDYDNYAALVTSNVTQNNTYFQEFEKFLQITIPTCVKIVPSSTECERIITPVDHMNNIVWSNEDGKNIVKVVRIPSKAPYTNVIFETIALMNNHRDTLKKELESKFLDKIGPEDAMVWAWGFLFTEREEQMRRMIVQTILYAALAVLAVVSLFLHPLSVFIIALSIASIDGALFIIMYLSEIPIDATSFLCLTMSIGLSVDYACHIAHAFENSQGGSTIVIERLRDALAGVGKSVAKGGVSTFTGICVLAFSNSNIFRTFFKLLFSTVILGLSVGLVFFPACITLVGKWIKPTKLSIDNNVPSQDS